MFKNTIKTFINKHSTKHGEPVIWAMDVTFVHLLLLVLLAGVFVFFFNS